MNEPPPSEPDDFQKELEILRSILQENLQQAKQDPLLGTQVEFWLESAKFLELNIKIWGEEENEYHENQSRERMHKVLNILQELINKINDGKGNGKA